MTAVMQIFHTYILTNLLNATDIRVFDERLVSHF